MGVTWHDSLAPSLLTQEKLEIPSYWPLPALMTSPSLLAQAEVKSW